VGRVESVNLTDEFSKIGLKPIEEESRYGISTSGKVLEESWSMTALRIAEANRAKPRTMEMPANRSRYESTIPETVCKDLSQLGTAFSSGDKPNDC